MLSFTGDAADTFVGTEEEEGVEVEPPLPFAVSTLSSSSSPAASIAAARLRHSLDDGRRAKARAAEFEQDGEGVAVAGVVVAVAGEVVTPAVAEAAPGVR